MEKERCRKEGFAEGRAAWIAAGRAEGSSLARLEIAAKMKVAGVDPATISDYTGLFIKDIAEI